MTARWSKKKAIRWCPRRSSHQNVRSRLVGQDASMMESIESDPPPSSHVEKHKTKQPHRDPLPNGRTCHCIKKEETGETHVPLQLQKNEKVTQGQEEVQGYGSLPAFCLVHNFHGLQYFASSPHNFHVIRSMQCACGRSLPFLADANGTTSGRRADGIIPYNLG